MNRPLFILGTGGLAREMAMLVEQINVQKKLWIISGFISKSSFDHNQGYFPSGPWILRDDDWLLSQNIEADLVIGIGYPRIKEQVVKRYLEQGERFSYPNLIHPRVDFDLRRVKLGRGNIITAGCALTCDISIGDFNLFNLNTTVGHDAHIGDLNVFNPSVNISGYARIGDCVLVGTGSQILERVKVGSNAIIGAGAVVTKDVPTGARVVGIPAKPIDGKI